MTTSSLIDKLNLHVFAAQNDRTVSGCYIGDLLSWVMGRAKADDCWLTVMNNSNVLAVAKLTDCACIILCEGVEPAQDVIAKAKAQKITLLGSSLTMFELAKQIASLI